MSNLDGQEREALKEIEKIYGEGRKPPTLVERRIHEIARAALAAREEPPEGFRDEDIEALRRTQERYRTSREEGDYATREEPPPSDDADFAAWCSEIPKET